MQKPIGEGFIDHQSGIAGVRTRGPVTAIGQPNDKGTNGNCVAGSRRAGEAAVT
jgi:hypothetical protein